MAERALDLEILTGKSPLSIAGAVVFMVGKLLGCEKPNMSEICETSTMKDSTIKNCLKIMGGKLDELVRGFEMIDQNKIMAFYRISNTMFN